MMGSPRYYDVYFHHECMWSGSCCLQLRQTDVQQDNKQQPTILQLQATPITFSSSTPPFQFSTPTPTPTLSPTSTPPLQISTPTTSSVQLITSSSAAAASSPFNTLEPALPAKPPRATPVQHHHHHQHQATTTKAQHPTRSGAQHAKQHAASRSALVLNRTQHGRIRPKSAADNKKLRHREVEKNRHRQLQAMVKTLSEQIPGRVDKETQVQTMKRAARYCLYLRDVLNHGQSMNKDKLERLYQRSCENVDLMMDGRQSMD